MVRRRGHATAFLVAIVLLSAFAGCSGKKPSTTSATEEPPPDDAKSTRGSRPGSDAEGDGYNYTFLEKFRLTLPMTPVDPPATKDVKVGGAYGLVRVTTTLYANFNNFHSAYGMGVAAEGPGVHGAWENDTVFVHHQWSSGFYSSWGGTTYWAMATYSGRESVAPGENHTVTFHSLGWGDMYAELVIEAAHPIPTEENDEESQ